MGVPQRYLKYRIPYGEIKSIISRTQKSRINFFIDLQSICKGLYNKDNIFYEIQYYIDNQTPSDTLVLELKQFLNNIWTSFKPLKVFFIIFYDDGKNRQNTGLQASYKGGRSGISDILIEDDMRELYFKVKHRYFDEVEKKFTKDNAGKVFYLKDYESDFIPFYCISREKFESESPNTLNVVLSVDKDLLQCCQFDNTIQCTNRFFPSKSGGKQLAIELWDKNNAITYIYDKFKPGILTAEHIPLILAIAGDKADNISGLPGIGNKKAMDLIQNYNIPAQLPKLEAMKDQLPSIIANNFKLIKQNFKMISFVEQTDMMFPIFERLGI